MSHRVNSEGFRLGSSRFWKTELFSSYISNFTQKFLGVYLLLKKKLDAFFVKIVFFKIIFLRGQKVFILANIYKVQKRVTASARKGSGVRGRPIKSFRVKRVRKKSAFKSFLLSKRYPLKVVVSRDRKKGIFKTNGLALSFINFRVERCLERLLLSPVEIKLKNIFSLKKKQVRSRTLRVVSLCRLVYKKTKSFWQIKSFLFLKDGINILSLSFFYQKSDLLANYISDIIKVRRKFLFELKSLKGLLPVFKEYYFLNYSASLKINVLGKIFGQRKRRFRCFSIQEGLKFSTQDVKANISYSLTQSWNVFGSFGVKVWIFKQ